MDEAGSPSSFPNEAFEKLATRAAAAGIPYRHEEWGRPGKYMYWAAELDMPRGKDIRTVRLSESEAEQLLTIQFETFRFTPDFFALFDTATGEVEAMLTLSPALYPRGQESGVWDLPGVELTDDSPLKTGEEVSEYTVPSGWRIAVTNGEVSMELSPVSANIQAFFGRFQPFPDVTLKLIHSAGANGPRAQELLERFGEDFIMDMELKYQTGFSIARHGGGRNWLTEDRVPSSLEPTFPGQHYQQDALAFYWYGVSAEQFPLLRYLAFYQVLEYFFASFTRRSALNRVRTQLKDPAFDAMDDQALSLLVDSTRTAHAGLKREAEQLLDTILECVEPDALKAFIRADKGLVDHFLGATQPIKGTKTLRLDAPDQEIREQVADRVYKIRNRIVHTKQFAEDVGLELLLPASEETNSLGPELELIRWLAQRALIHGARPY